MGKIKEVRNEDIFSYENSLTNLIKGKKLRKKLYDNGVKFQVEKGGYDLGIGFGFSGKRLFFTFYRPADLDKGIFNEIVLEVSGVITRKHELGCSYNHVIY